MSTDLAAFLHARIAEDEEAAYSVAEVDGEEWTPAIDVGDEYNVAVVTPTAPDNLLIATHRDALLVSPSDVQVARCGVDGMESGELRTKHIARHDPGRVLADCAAKRAIVRRAQEAAAAAADMTPTLSDDYPIHDELAANAELWDQVLRLLTQPWADHPDYHPDWQT